MVLYTAYHAITAKEAAHSHFPIRNGTAPRARFARAPLNPHLCTVRAVGALLEATLVLFCFAATMKDRAIANTPISDE